jgi:hypothetical protein
MDGLQNPKEETDMSDSDDVEVAFERYTKALAEANQQNKEAVFDALAAAGVTTVSAEFDGEGDSGQIDAITACRGDEHVTLSATPVTLRYPSSRSDALTTAETPLSEAIETLCFDYLSEKHGYWQDNEGAFGTFAFDVARRAIALEFNGRFIEIATHNHDL